MTVNFSFFFTKKQNFSLFLAADIKHYVTSVFSFTKKTQKSTFQCGRVRNLPKPFSLIFLDVILTSEFPFHVPNSPDPQCWTWTSGLRHETEFYCLRKRKKKRNHTDLHISADYYKPHAYGLCLRSLTLQTLLKLLALVTVLDRIPWKASDNVLYWCNRGKPCDGSWLKEVMCSCLFTKYFFKGNDILKSAITYHEDRQVVRKQFMIRLQKSEKEKKSKRKNNEIQFWTGGLATLWK